MKRILKATGVVGTGILIHRTFNWMNGFVVSPLVVAYVGGYWESVFLMSLYSIITCYIFVRVYDFFKQDCMLIEVLKQGEREDQNALAKLLHRLQKMGRLPLLVVLVFWDPVVAVLYFRKGAFAFNGMPEAKAKIIFIASAFLCNVLWTALIFGLFSMKDIFVPIQELLSGLFFLLDFRAVSARITIVPKYIHTFRGTRHGRAGLSVDLPAGGGFTLCRRGGRLL